MKTSLVRNVRYAIHLPNHAAERTFDIQRPNLKPLSKLQVNADICKQLEKDFTVSETSMGYREMQQNAQLMLSLGLTSALISALRHAWDNMR